jgi:septum formation protein
MAPHLVLASGSPRRQELLAQLGIAFEAKPPRVDERLADHLPISQAVVELATGKAQAVLAEFPGAVVIAADTVVILDGQILGKPHDEANAKDMLRRLRGQWHAVVTGLVVMAPHAASQDAVVTCVKMRSYSDDEIEAYVRSKDPLDKAGAYAIQNKNFDLVEQVQGCPTNVVGLPLCTLYGRLIALGVEVPVRPDRLCEQTFGGRCLLNTPTQIAPDAMLATRQWGQVCP